MKILILCAMDKELSLLLANMDNCRQLHDHENINIYEGSIARHDIIAAKCGIGKVNAALRTVTLLKRFNPDLVINTGVAGGTDTSVSIGSVMLPTEVAYHDVWCGPGTRVGEADGCPVRFTPDADFIEAARNIDYKDAPMFEGLICSGDRFISTADEVAAIKSNFKDALACDMESAAIAHACHITGTPFGILRVMSDTPGQGENISQYENFWSEAPARTFGSLRLILDRLCNVKK